MVALPMHGSKLDKIIAELFFIEISCFLFFLNNSSQIFHLADQLGRVSSCGSSSSGHHTCNSIGCTKVWLCWMMVSLKSFLLNIQRPLFKNAIPITYMCDTRNISDYLLLYSWFFSTAIYRSWKQTKFPIFTTSSNNCNIFTPDMIFVQNLTLADFQAKNCTP